MAEGLSVDWRTKTEYERGLDRRLNEDDWKEGVIYTFMGTTKGRGPEALAVPVDLKKLHVIMSQASFILCMKDVDLNTCFEMASRSKDGIWTPDTKIVTGLRITQGPHDVVVTAAYLKPYEGDIEMPSLEGIMSIDRSLALV